MPDVPPDEQPPADSGSDVDPLGLARDIADSYRGASTPPLRRRRRRPTTTGGRVNRDDPVPVSDVMGELVRARGWDERLNVQRVFTDWPAVVGPDVAAHSSVEGFEDGVLTVRADSTSWAKELQLLAPGLVRRLNAELGQDTVLRVDIRGPQAPSWKRGRRAVRDGRGPRDTYG
ncbi:MAG TPA: DciA family protein [Aeromicrobium sp.]|nr:DciA family protein [Aeromicrobium sp.]HKY57937.1 DciA family protein [Aeromicrobium sp.]